MSKRKIIYFSPSPSYISSISATKIILINAQYGMSKNRLGQNRIFLGHFYFSAIALFMGISQNLGHFWAVLPIRTYSIYFFPKLPYTPICKQKLRTTYPY